jgi:hypothetical protein
MNIASYFNGRDGFLWWFGVVEDRNDPESLGRVKVRVIGYHTADKTDIPTADLPWAWTVQPVNGGSSGGIGSSPMGPIEGTWVFGFWRDPSEMQEPMVLGTLPGRPGVNAIPRAQSPYDYSDAQRLPPTQIAETSVVSSGQTTFATPADTTNSVVLVKVNGVVQTPNNNPSPSLNNTEVRGNLYDATTNDDTGSVQPEVVTEGGTTYTANDFSGSRYANNIASKINQIAPSVRDRFAQGIKKFLADNSGDGYDCNIAFAYRSLAAQRQLRARYEAGGPKAAPAGFSWHNYASAIDLTIYVNGRYDDGSRGVSNYTQVARTAFAPFGLVNEISGDSGHFYPAAFGKTPPSRLRNGSITLAEYASETGVA